MKHTFLLLLIPLAILSCKKKEASIPVVTVTHLDSAFKADYDFKPGSYWILQDSVSGETDSAYVASHDVAFPEVKGCALTRAVYLHEEIDIVIRIAHPDASDGETWTLRLWHGNLLSYLFVRSAEPTAAHWLSTTELFRYPAQAGRGPALGCVYFDSTYVALIPALNTEAGSFDGVVAAGRLLRRSALIYNDCAYLNPAAGFIKMTFDHPLDTVKRVLKVKRYKVIK